MKLRLSCFFLTLFFFFALPFNVAAQTTNSAPNLGIVQAGPHFFSGDTVVLTENLEGDVFVAGGRVRVEGAIDGDLIVAGGDVTLSGQVTQDVRVAGGTILISGPVGGNITAAGGTITLENESVVGNSVVVVGGSINTQGLIAGQAWLAGGTLVTDNAFGSDLKIWSNSLTMLSATTVAGSLTAELGQEPEISDQAQFQQEPRISLQERVDPSPLDFHKIAIIPTIFLATMNLTLGAILLYFFPRLTQKLTNSVVKGPATTLGWGFVHFLLVPVFIIFLAITIVGMPLAALLGLSYLASLLVGSLVSAMAIGSKFSSMSSGNALSDPYAQLVVGVVVLSILGMIPFVGPIISLISLILGLGAIFIAFKSSLRLPRSVSKKLT